MDAYKVIELHLSEPTNFSIFPQLANVVSKHKWNALADVGITPSNYTTHGILKEKPIENSFSLNELLIVDIPKKLVKPNDEFYSYTNVKEISKESIQCLKEALDILNCIEGLYSTINILVKNLHILRSQIAEIDVSYSLPNIPFSIFVSLPVSRQTNDYMRVAEGVLHETMHLQLSLIENIWPLVRDENDRYYSPWKNETRNIQGILHGLYVFKIIQQFYKQLKLQSTKADKAFLNKRLYQIQDEINMFNELNTLNSLTTKGNYLINNLIKN